MLLPAKAFFAAAGAVIKTENGKVTVVRDGIKVEGLIGSSKATVGQAKYDLPAAVQMAGGILYIPVKFAGLCVGMDSVSYDTAKRQLRFSYSSIQMDGFQSRLYQVARAGKTDVIQQLLDLGVDPDLKLKKYGNQTALDYAVIGNQTQAVRLLLQHGKVFNPNDGSQAIASRNAEILGLLLEHGLNPNLKSAPTGRTLLEEACSQLTTILADGRGVNRDPDLKTVQVLLQHGADPSQDNSLSQAIEWGSFQIVQAFCSTVRIPAS